MSGDVVGVRIGHWQLSFEWTWSDKCQLCPYMHNADLRDKCSDSLLHHFGHVRWWSLNWLWFSATLLEEYQPNHTYFWSKHNPR